MNKKLLISILMCRSVNKIFSTYATVCFKHDKIYKFEILIKILTDSEINHDLDNNKEVIQSFIDNYSKVESGNSKDFELTFLYTFDKYDGTKKYICEIIDDGTLIFNDIKEIPQEGIPLKEGKNYFIIIGKKTGQDKTLLIKVFKQVPVNKKIDKDGIYKDNIQNN